MSSTGIQKTMNGSPKIFSKDKKDKKEKKLSKSLLLKNEFINKDNTVLAIKGKDLMLTENLDYLGNIAK